MTNNPLSFNPIYSTNESQMFMFLILILLQNYLTNHEYVCFLQQDNIRRSIHTGTRAFNRGQKSFIHLNNTIMASKKHWLEESLERGGIEVLVYNGNLDVIVNVAGTNRVINSLQWSGKGEFVKSERKNYWVWNPESNRGELGNAGTNLFIYKSPSFYNFCIAFIINVSHNYTVFIFSHII